jgi:DNA modification methylase
MTSPILHHGDSLDVLRAMPSASVDAIVTDPPYGLAFMGKRWDYDVPSVDLWAECLRVVKPGGHLLSFAGTRTQHRMAVRIEDGGFEIRDMLAWVYGSGFPKSLDVSKAIDKAAGAEREVVGERDTKTGSDKARNTFMASPRMMPLTAPATDAAREWSGWGTALKPALEPITLARAPFRGTVAENVQRHGTGALNIDGCRVGNGGDRTSGGNPSRADFAPGWGMASTIRATGGRFPANLIHDGSDEVEAVFPQQANDSASRFFYCAKASKRERGAENNHPTVKPLALMCYLVRLITPPGGIVLDPFMGSGTTALACREEGFGFIGIEREAEYIATARRRLAA